MRGNSRLGRIVVALVAIGTTVALQNPRALAQSKTIRLIVPFPPGGSTDSLARLLAQQAAQMSGHSVLTENRPGVSTIIATEFVSRATPDGTTLLLMANSFVINPSVRTSLPYDPFGFEPICLLVTSPQVLVVNADFKYQNLASFVMAAKARPGDFNYAAVGPATTQHIAGEMFKRSAQINLTYVPYTGGGPAVSAILGGHVSTVLANFNEVQEHIKSGKLRALAVASPTRIAPLPDVPTMAEAGFKDVEATAWFGMLAPPRTPRDIVSQTIALFKAALDAPEVASKLIAQGLYPANACGADFATHIKQQFESYARVIKEANITVN